MSERDASAAGGGPIFIGGAGRSGKTLLRWILSSHSRISVSRRTDMWPRFYGRYGDLARPENLDRCIEAMLARKQIAALSPDVESLRLRFSLGAPTYARLFALIQAQHAERLGKPRWGDQTESVERYAAELVSSYPGARIIQMIRDPRDRYEAIVQRGRRGPGVAGRAMAEWLASYKLARRNLDRYPDDCRVVRYEALVAEPAVVVRAICAFLGETFEPAMLRMERAHRYDAERASSTDGIPISTAHVGRYRDEVDRSDLAFIQSMAGRQMMELGYEPGTVKLTMPERIRWLTVGWPVNAASLGSRRAIAALGVRPRAAAAPEMRS